MTYEQFARDLWAHTKLLAVEPLFSMGEIVLMLAWLAYRPSEWVTLPLLFVWMVWRNSRRVRDASYTENAEGG